MADKWRCPFCNSEEMILDTPYIDKHGEKETTYCCNQQKRNHEYLKAHRSQWSDEELDPDEISRF